MQSKGVLRMLTKLYFLLGLMALTLSSCSRDKQGQSSVHSEPMLNSEACRPPPEGVESQRIEIADLAAHPAKYDGMFVAVDGFYYSGFELSAIFPSARNPDTSIRHDGLWVTGISPFAKVGRDRVRLFGIVRAREKGHMNLWPASICVYSLHVSIPAEQ